MENSHEMEGSIRSGNLERVLALIRSGTDVNACCMRQGMPILSLAIKLNHPEIALELIDHGADVRAKDAIKGRTALHWACKDEGREDVVRRLIERGSCVNEKDSMDVTPLSLAAAWCGVVPARYLLQAGANCKVLSRRQMNVLFLPACWHGDLFVARTLLANGCDVNARTQSGEPAIMLAVDGGHEEVVKMLILKGAELDLQDLEDGSTALHHAALNNHIQCGVLLTEGGANMGVKDKHSRTALCVARSEEFKEAIKQAQSYTISKIVCAVGNSGVGKSTLVAALQAERNSFIGKTFNRVWRVADHRKRTAGIETTRHTSQRYGETLFFDFAGQHEYYGPHQTFLESFLCKPGVSMTLLLVVKATDGEEAILEQLYYWLFPIAEMATSAVTGPPQVIIIGSYLDHVKSQDEATAKLMRCIEETRKSLKNTLPMKFAGCLLNCRQPQSIGIDQLCHFLQEVPIPKLKAIHTQYSLAWVLSQIKLVFKDEPAVQLHTLAKWMQENRINLPLTIPSPEAMCKDLSATGYALYLPNKDHRHDGWLVLDLPRILHDCYGALFARPKASVNRFGLFHRTDLPQLFPLMGLKMAQQMLTTLKFCTPVDLMFLNVDMNKLTANEENSGWLFFPAFVTAKPPMIASNDHRQQRICSLWWQLRTKGKHFVFARVLQAIILHLAAHFVCRADGIQQHCCNIWWNGISWQSKEGIDVTVHITNRVINVVGVSEETADKLCQYLTEVIADVISTVRQVSPNLKANAYIVHRPLKSTVSQEELAIVAPSDKDVFPVTGIIQSIKDCNTHLLQAASGDCHSSRTLVADLFGGHTPSLEDTGRILWTPNARAPMLPQSLAELNIVLTKPQIPSPSSYASQVRPLSQPILSLVSNPIVSLSLKLISYH